MQAQVMVNQFHKKMRHESALQINHARNISRSRKKIIDPSSTTALDPRVPQLQEQLSVVARFQRRDLIHRGD